LRSKRNKVLASNIANAATPHFKARDIDFDAEMQKAQREGPLRTTSNKHFPVLAKSNGKEMLYRQPLTASRDGNTVEMNVEQMEFSENVMRYQTSLTFLNNRITGLLSAIRGE
jgi:flagellar basal-body rod protein FlgB